MLRRLRKRRWGRSLLIILSFSICRAALAQPCPGLSPLLTGSSGKSAAEPADARRGAAERGEIFGSRRMMAQPCESTANFMV